MKTTHHPPSLALQVENELAAYCLDGAVLTLGTIIENALLEREPVGPEGEQERQPRYTLTQLLRPGFHLPRPPTEKQKRAQVGAELRALVGQNKRRKA